MGKERDRLRANGRVECRVAGTGCARDPTVGHFGVVSHLRSSTTMVYKTLRAPAYLDHNATTKLWPEAKEALRPFLEGELHGNPSSSHGTGRAARQMVEHARKHVARLVGARSEQEILFCSCGTEADNHALHGAIELWQRKNLNKDKQHGRERSILPHVVTGGVEHDAVLKWLQHYQDEGRLTYTAVPPDANGLITPHRIQMALQENTALVTVMHSNNEVGTLQPVQEIATVAKESGALVHCDAAQSCGKVPIDVRTLGVDLLTIVGHKFGAPKGVAALYIRSELEPFPALLIGGGQEGGRRSGTENTLLIAALGAVAEAAVKEGGRYQDHMRATRDRLWLNLKEGIPESARLRLHSPINVKEAGCLPNTLSIGMVGINARKLLQEVEGEVEASGGSACHGDGTPVSPVLTAMGVPTEYLAGTLRLSTGRDTTFEEIEAASQALVKAVQSQLLHA